MDVFPEEVDFVEDGFKFAAGENAVVAGERSPVGRLSEAGEPGIGGREFRGGVVLWRTGQEAVNQAQEKECSNQVEGG